MSQFSSSFWDIYIAVITLVSVLACGVFLKMQSVRRVAGSGSETTGHTWDEDLGEYNNPLPRWWMWLFYITIVFALVYLALYPGLGSWKGLLGWSEVGQLKQEEARAEAMYGPIFDKFAKQDIVALAKNPDALAIGQKLFLNNCAQCHASDGGGSRGFPNLTDNDWLYGGDPATIEQTITNGRNGVMPPWGPVLGAEGVKDVANYVDLALGRRRGQHPGRARPGDLRQDLLRLPRRRRQGHARGRRAEPDRQDLALRRRRADRDRNHHQRPQRPHADLEGHPRARQDSSPGGLRVLALARSRASRSMRRGKAWLNLLSK